MNPTLRDMVRQAEGAIFRNLKTGNTLEDGQTDSDDTDSHGNDGSDEATSPLRRPAGRGPFSSPVVPRGRSKRSTRCASPSASPNTSPQRCAHTIQTPTSDE